MHDTIAGHNDEAPALNSLFAYLNSFLKLTQTSKIPDMQDLVFHRRDLVSIAFGKAVVDDCSENQNRNMRFFDPTANYLTLLNTDCFSFYTTNLKRICCNHGLGRTSKNWNAIPSSRQFWPSCFCFGPWGLAHVCFVRNIHCLATLTQSTALVDM